ncbi:hypothetical protein BKA58DRAFT_381163 [Alternaria rosae]|uniref:uncharacterized protein n=1 Tax=Alternaria rosae TaxID=1187941 RepID=UPI001E8CCAF4|nr:uncharacterized protein BKA58DRAFT_381163 [Alternaria rosae]KAH6876171.1 hypothetical protein BKA58DRAFT_381163 [Alternaria rosae]
MRVTAESSAEDVRQKANFNAEQWRQFLSFTAQKATELLKEDSKATWENIGETQRKCVVREINKQLVKEKIPPVEDEDVFKWRISKTFYDRRSKLNKSAGKSASSSAATQSSEETRPYDPVRDV